MTQTVPPRARLATTRLGAPFGAEAAERSDEPVVDRLLREFGPTLSESNVRELVHRCRRDLAGSPRTAMPELVERLARQRLVQERASA